MIDAVRSAGNGAGSRGSGARFGRRIDRVRRFVRGPMVLVYTMGKVGSTSLENVVPGAYHTHTLFGNPPCPPYHRLKYGRIGMLFRKFTVYPLKRLMLRSRRQVRIVTFYRDPRQRNPSMFMQDLPFWLVDYLQASGSSNRAEEPGLLIDAYRSIFPHGYPVTWVERELARFTGIPAGELNLGHEHYRILTRGRYALFIGRTESFDECLPRLAEFLELPGLGSIDKSNRGASKWYAPLYAELLLALHDDPTVDFAEDFRRANGYADTKTS